jgi:leader peptidase (prepilin peptidase)/N-methyltransferase
MLLYTKFLIGGFTLGAWITFGFAAVVAALLIVITVYDLRHKIIPDQVVYPLMLLAFASIIWRAVQDPYTTSAWGLILGGLVVALPFFVLWYFSKGRAMGFGDVKLALAIGWLVGITQGFTAVLLAFWIGAIVGLVLVGISRRYGMKSEIAFGPFLVIGLCIVVFWGVTIQSLFPVWQ